MSKHSRFLLTGAGGFLGTGFLASLTPDQAKRCVCITRKITSELERFPGKIVEGFFGDAADLRKLDDTPISAVIHLAAVTGGCSEADAAAVNVEGSRVLMRHFIDKGCRHFVLASSVAAVGIQRTDFRPLSLPVDDEHPCFDRHGYGFSKYLMEEQARYFCRQNPDLNVTCLRFGSITPDDKLPQPFEPRTLPPSWTLGWIANIARKDAVRALHLALKKSAWPGVHVMNIVGQRANLAVPMEQLVKTWYPGWKTDLSHYQRPGHEFDSAFSTARTEKELGFIAKWPPKNSSAT